MKCGAWVAPAVARSVTARSASGPCEPVIPPASEFPYTIRIVSEVLGSNGSTSQASICAGTLALMDAGVPIKEPVAGVAMGLMTGEGDDYKILTDIAGLEDHLGDMDFKVAGTDTGITAVQADFKIHGLTLPMIEEIVERARIGRMFILGKLNETIEAPRKELSRYAPRMYRIQIPREKIGVVIGPGGKMVRSIIEETKCTVDVEDDGSVYVGSTNEENARKAIAIIEGLTQEAVVGQKYTGRVTRTVDFGAFVEIMPGKEGLVRIGELADYRVPTVEDVVQVGDEIEVMVLEIDNLGRINLSRRAVLEGTEPEELEAPGEIPSPMTRRSSMLDPMRSAAASATARGGGGDGGFNRASWRRWPRRWRQRRAVAPVAAVREAAASQPAVAVLRLQQLPTTRLEVLPWTRSESSFPAPASWAVRSSPQFRVRKTWSQSASSRSSRQRD